MYPTKPLGEVIKIIRGITYKPINVLQNGGIACFRTKNIQQKLDETDIVYIEKNIVKNPEKFLKNGDILVSSANSLELLGKCCLIENLSYEATLGGFITCFRSTEHINYKYFYYFYSSEKIQQIVRGFSKKTTGIANLQLKEAENLQIPLPPLPTQQKIVSKLDNLFSKIDKNISLTKQNIANIDEENNSILEKTFKECEKEFEKKFFKNIIENFDNKRKPVKASERKNDRGGKIPYYGASGIIDYVDDFTHEGEFLLISEDGGNLIMRTYPIAFIAKGKIWVNNHAHVVGGINGISDINFLKYFFANLDISSFITGSAQPKLSQGKLNEIQIPLPPLPKQQEIVTYLDNIFEKNSELKNFYEKNLKNLEELKQSLLKQAFEDENFIQ